MILLEIGVSFFYRTISCNNLKIGYFLNHSDFPLTANDLIVYQQFEIDIFNLVVNII